MARYTLQMATRPKSRPFSIRISGDAEELIAAEARRTRRSKGAVVESLAEESLRTRMFPGVAFRGDDFERRAWVIGTTFDVWQVIDAYRDLGSVEALVAAGNLTERAARLALAYYERFPSEIDEAIASNRRPLSRLRSEYPFIETQSPIGR